MRDLIIDYIVVLVYLFLTQVRKSVFMLSVMRNIEIEHLNEDNSYDDLDLRTNLDSLSYVNQNCSIQEENILQYVVRSSDSYLRNTKEKLFYRKCNN